MSTLWGYEFAEVRRKGEMGCQGTYRALKRSLGGLCVGGREYQGLMGESWDLGIGKT